MIIITKTYWFWWAAQNW